MKSHQTLHPQRTRFLHHYNVSCAMTIREDKQRQKNRHFERLEQIIPRYFIALLTGIATMGEM